MKIRAKENPPKPLSRSQTKLGLAAENTPSKIEIHFLIINQFLLLCFNLTNLKTGKSL